MSYSSSTIISVAEMIDSAFGEPDVNAVNHKLIQTILYLLARQLRILERRVEIEIGTALQPSSSSLSVTEVKVHAMQKKKKRLVKGTASKSAVEAGRDAGGVGGRLGGGGMGGSGKGGGGMGRSDMGGGGMGAGGMGGGGMGAGGMGGGGMGAGGIGGTGAGQDLGRSTRQTAGEKGRDAGGAGGRIGGGGMEKSGKGGGGMGVTGAGQDVENSRRQTGQQGRASTSGGLAEKPLSASDKTSSNKTASDKTPSQITASDKSASDKTSSQITASDKSASEKTSSQIAASDKTASEKTSSQKTASEKTSSQKTTSDKTFSDKTTSDKTSDKTTSDKTTSDKTSSDKISSDKTSSGKTTSDKTSSDKTFSDKTSTAADERNSTDKTFSGKTTSGKTYTDKTTPDKTSSGKTSSAKITSDKISTEKSSSDKTSWDKTSTEKSSSDKTSSVKTSSDKTSSVKISSDKTSSDKTSSDKTSSDKTSSDKTSSEKPPSSEKTLSEQTLTEKISSKDKTSSSDKRSSTTTEKSTTEKTSTEKSSSSEKKTTTDTNSSSRRGPGDYGKLLEAVEEQRETELRVIHQRADSREEHEKTPSPMASLDSVEAKYEKLLVVERIPADEAKALAARRRSGSRDKAPQISVVTQQQFEELAITVRQLQEKFGPVGSASFPENIQLMHELRKGASLTDAMAALQLSARLEASEKTLEQMLSLVTDLASKTPGFDMTGSSAGEEMEVLFGVAGGGAGGGTGGGAGAGADGAKGKVSLASRKSTITQKTGMKKEPSPQQSSSEESVVIPLPQPALQEIEESAAAIGGTEKEQPDRITYEELDNALQELHDNIMKTVTNLTMKSTVNAENAFKTASKLEGKLEASLNLGTRMQDLEALVTDYSEQINILDTSLSSQLTNYQEELTQMQHDLETALETMAEVLASAGGDTTAVAELNNQFSNLQSDIDDTFMRQKELKNTQNALALDLESLRKQIEILREAKSDREEVADALRDKAGLGALNGLVSLQQFDAVRGDMEKRIGNAYDKFNSQETIWQKAIDDLLRALNEKADWIQVVSLKEEVNKHLEMLRCRLNTMMEIVGEPKAAAVAKKLHRDVTCLSCAAPADMELEEHGIVPALPGMRPPAIGAEAPKPKEDGDHGPCYPGRPIPHPRDPRSLFCQRWCGGSHTVISNTINRVPPSMIITPAVRQVSTALGTDGKMYMVDQPGEPCRQCQKTIPQPSIPDQNQGQEAVCSDSTLTPSDFRPSLGCAMQVPENETPPPPQDDD